MKRPLLDVMFASEKRKNVLLLLQDGPKEMEELLKALDTTRQALLPQVRVLEDHHLVSHERDLYTLTSVGKLVIDEIAPAIGTTDVLSDNIDFWGTHDLSFIPPYLLQRIREIGECHPVNVQLHEAFDEDETFIETAKETKFLYNVSSFVFPHVKELFSELTASGVEISLIISNELYEKLVRENPEDFKYLIKNPNIKVYRYPGKFGFLSFTVTDHKTMMRLLTLKSDYDNQRIICSSESALKWGKELFEYYLKNSSPVTEIEE